jgi:hypothetical protein
MYGHEVELPGDGGRISVPSLRFNIFFQMAHMMHHFMDEGIGLRHMVDYYYLLRKVHEEGIPTDGIDQELNRLGLRKFAGAVMFVMHEVLGLEDEGLIVPMDKKRGKTLLNEILNGGNFGKYSGLTKHSLASKNITNLYPGTADEAEKDSAGVLQPTTDKVTYSDGKTESVYGFDIPVDNLDEEFDLALLGKKGKWYDHKVKVTLA